MNVYLYATGTRVLYSCGIRFQYERHHGRNCNTAKQRNNRPRHGIDDYYEKKRRNERSFDDFDDLPLSVSVVTRLLRGVETSVMSTSAANTHVSSVTQLMARVVS